MHCLDVFVSCSALIILLYNIFLRFAIFVEWSMYNVIANECLKEASLGHPSAAILTPLGVILNPNASEGEGSLNRLLPPSPRLPNFAKATSDKSEDRSDALAMTILVVKGAL